MEMMTLDLKELTAFQTVLKEGSFAKAAAKLNYAQSTITNQIQRLEKELGFLLFRRGWEAELTPAGSLYAAEVEQLIRHWHYAAEQAKAILREDIGHLRIGMLETLAATAMPTALQQFRGQKPGVTCSMVIGNTDSLATELKQEKLDFAICGEPAEAFGFRFEPLYEEKIVFAAAWDHPIHQTGNVVPFEELLPYPLFAGGATCLYYLRLSKHLSRYDKLPMLYSISQISAIPSFVSSIPSAIGVVLASTPLPAGLSPISVDWNEAPIPVGLLQRRDAYPSTAKELMMTIIRDLSSALIWQSQQHTSDNNRD